MAVPTVLFLHQNFPGQFRHLARHLALDRGWRVVALGEAANLERQTPVEGVEAYGYRFAPSKPSGHPYLSGLETQVRQGQAVLRALLRLKARGLAPQLICAHPSWGEALFIRQAYPDAKLIDYCEFFYRSQGADVGFDPEFPAPDIDALCRLGLRNAAQLQALADCDRIWCPSRWQASSLPEVFHSRVDVVHEGIDTCRVAPDAAATFSYGGLTLTAKDSVITYVARNLEPYRGFHRFMRALPKILAGHPAARAVIVGGDQVSYGRPPAGAPCWREKMLAEIGAGLDLDRVVFTGKLPYRDYLALLQISSVHVYLTYPFVLSWSLLEAMAVGCAVVASRTAPVEEVMRDGENGSLVDFFDNEGLIDRVSQALADAEVARNLRLQARQTIVDRYDLESICLPRQVALFQELLD